MLDLSLRAVTRPQANSKNICFFADYRITVLGEGLFRLEKSPTKKFRDDATQAVWFRDMPVQEYTATITEKQAVIKTKKAILVLFPTREDCYVEVAGKRLAIDNQENLGGTYRTLDCCDGENIRANDVTRKIVGKVQLEKGVCSKNGVAVYDDSKSLTLSKEGEILAESGEGSDEYIFVFPNDYRGAVKALYSITGDTPLLPRFVFGNWWSRYYPYSDKEYLRLLDKFAEEDIPLTVATVDMDWHYVDEKEIDETFRITELGRMDGEFNGNYGWTGYTWNKRLFPDHVQFLKEVHERNLRVTLNLHPADGIRWWETGYVAFATKMGMDPNSYRQIKFDVSSEYINAYYSVIISGLEEEGVDFWWIDWQQGTVSSVPGLDPLWINNHFHTLDSQHRHGGQGITLSRYSGVGSHRYPLGFSGDSYMTWNTLGYLPYFTATASNIGYTWWSHDIGGHMFGETCFELYLRHLQFGVFSPINRLHSANMPIVTKEPWAYGNGTGEIAKKFLRIRHSMLPFLYSCSYKTHKEGVPLIEPLYYAYPNSSEAYEMKNEYFFGGLLVIPVTEKLGKDGYAPIDAWIPEGKWTDVFTGDEYVAPVGGRKVTLFRSLDSIPVLAKAGMILPLSLDKGNGIENPIRLAVNAYMGWGNYTLYENTEKGAQAFTEFSSTLEEGRYTLTVKAHGDEGVIPQSRSLKVCFQGVPEGEVCVLENGKQIACKIKDIDCLSVEFAFNSKKEYEVRMNCSPVNEMQRLQQSTLRVLTRAEGENLQKEQTYLRILKATSVQEYREILSDSQLSDGVKARLVETLL